MPRPPPEFSGWGLADEANRNYEDTGELILVDDVALLFESTEADLAKLEQELKAAWSKWMETQVTGAGSR